MTSGFVPVTVHYFLHVKRQIRNTKPAQKPGVYFKNKFETNLHVIFEFNCCQIMIF